MRKRNRHGPTAIVAALKKLCAEAGVDPASAAVLHFLQTLDLPALAPDRRVGEKRAEYIEREARRRLREVLDARMPADATDFNDVVSSVQADIDASSQSDRTLKKRVAGAVNASRQSVYTWEDDTDVQSAIDARLADLLQCALADAMYRYDRDHPAKE